MKFLKAVIICGFIAVLATFFIYASNDSWSDWLRINYLRGNFQGVVNKAEAILRGEPRNAVALQYFNQASRDLSVYKKARSYYSSKNYREALVLFENLLQNCPEASYIRKLKDKASRYLEKQQAQIRAKQMQDLQKKISLIKKAEKYISYGNYKKARSMLIELSAVYPGDAKIRDLLNEIEAPQVIRSAVKKEPAEQPVIREVKKVEKPLVKKAAPEETLPRKEEYSPVQTYKQAQTDKKDLIKRFKVAVADKDFEQARAIFKVLNSKYPQDKAVKTLITVLKKAEEKEETRKSDLRQKLQRERMLSDLASTKKNISGLIKERQYSAALNELSLLERIYPGEKTVLDYSTAMRRRLSGYLEKDEEVDVSFEEERYRQRLSADFSTAKQRVAHFIKEKEYDRALEELKELASVYPQEKSVSNYTRKMGLKVNSYIEKEEERRAYLERKDYQQKLKSDLASAKGKISRLIKEGEYKQALKELALLEEMYPGQGSVLSYARAMQPKIRSYIAKDERDKAYLEKRRYQKKLSSDFASTKEKVSEFIRERQYDSALEELELLQGKYSREKSVSDYARSMNLKINAYIDKEERRLALMDEKNRQAELKETRLKETASRNEPARVDRPASAVEVKEAASLKQASQPAAKKTLVTSSAAEKNKNRVIAQARNLIVLEEYEQAEQILIGLKGDFPDDKEVDSLINYVGLKISSKPPRRNPVESVSYEPQDEEFYSQASQGMGDEESSAFWETDVKEEHDIEKIIKIRNLYYKGLKLYKQGLYDEAVSYFQEVIKLEGNPRIYYTPSAKKIIDEAQKKKHKEEMKDALREEEESDRQMLRKAAEYSQPPYIEPAKTEVEIQPVAVVVIPEIRKKLEKRVTLDFDNVSLKYVAEFIAQETGANIILSGNVLEKKPKVTAKFDSTPAYEALKYMLKSAGLSFRVDEDLVWIALPEEIESEAIETRVYKLTKGAGLFTEFATSETSQAGILSSFASISKIETLEDTLKEAVEWPAEAKIVLDKRTNSLIISNTPKNLQVVEDILYNLDVCPYQILIEARFLEVDVTDLKELGIEWKTNSDAAIEQENGAFKHGVDEDSGVDFTAFTNAAEGFNLTYKGVLTDPQFQAILHALEKSNKTKTLSAPRITTLNNQLAAIKVVDEWIYPTRYEFQIVQYDLNGDGDYDDAGETEFQNVPTDFVRRDVGIILKVVPSMGIDSETISLSLIPEVSEATADYFQYTGDVSLPRFSSRNLATTVAVESGDTVVLGGLIKEVRTHNKSKVPLLGDIPLLGNLFRKEYDSIERRNLLIFVTARILLPSGEEMVLRK
ncbi:MAG: tetratricopeptide repeat protein [Candidatus Omnitrophica bacterium]|nr:tetratricopeptide repeat protein [Candidatus Omnitrophota bacterium]